MSPGGLPKGVSIESIQFGKTCQRNSLMASFCAKTMEYRGLGTGILRAVKEEQGNIHFENEEGSQFKVVIDRPLEERETPEYSGFIASETPVYEEHRKPLTSYGLRFSKIRSLCPTLPKGEEENAERLLSFCHTYQGMLEMMEATGYRSRTSFRRRLLIPLMESGLLEQEYKDRPNTPKQRYRSMIL